MGPRAVRLESPRLRLVDAEATAPAAPSPHARREVAREMHAAAFATNDIRWTLANQVSESLEGGRAAMLRPESRRRLIAGAERMGLKAFDANLVIAIVQDAARHGEPLTGSATPRLAMVPVRPTEQTRPLLLLAAAVLISAAVLALLVSWLMG